MSNSWDPLDCNPPGSSVHGIFQAGILEWVTISFSRRSSQPTDLTRVSWVAGGFFTIWATKEDQSFWFPISSHFYFNKHYFSMNMKIIAVKWQFFVNCVGSISLWNLTVYSEGPNTYPMDQNCLKSNICITYIKSAFTMKHLYVFH